MNNKDKDDYLTMIQSIQTKIDIIYPGSKFTGFCFCSSLIKTNEVYIAPCLNNKVKYDLYTVPYTEHLVQHAVWFDKFLDKQLEQLQDTIGMILATK